MPQLPTIVVDTREQRPLEFSDDWATRARALSVGDYSLLGHERGGVVVERKSRNDFFGSFTGASRGRMVAKLERMGEFASPLLLVESSVSAILRGHPYTDVQPRRLVGSVLAMCSSVGVACIFVPRAMAAPVVESFFDAYLRDEHGLSNRRRRL